jgi:hypothetical protein
VPHLAQWELADALLHARSRRGRSDRPYGRVFPFRGRWRPLPSSKTMQSSVSLPLAVPQPRADKGFAQVLETRRSHRAHASRPMHVRQLSEFLYRAARVQATLPREPRHRPYAATLRPSPSGGACHPLELYLVVNRCRGLARGIYHYDPVEHQLGRLDTPRQALQSLLDDCPPPVATALDLAPCALGGGDSERFARIIGRDFFDETSVGEFLLGSRPRRGSRVRERVQ